MPVVVGLVYQGLTQDDMLCQTGETAVAELSWKVETSTVEVDTVICVACEEEQTEDSPPDGGG